MAALSLMPFLSGCNDSFPSNVRDQAVHTPFDTTHSWTIITSPTSRDLNALDVHGSFAAIGGDDVVLLSNDSGNTWQAFTTPNQIVVRGIHFFDTQNGIIAGNGNQTFRTTDGARTWSPSPIAGFSNAICFLDSKLGFLAVDSGGGRSGIVYQTSDGGLTWQAIFRTPGDPMTAVRFVDQSIGSCATEQGAIYYTTDGGGHWVKGSHVSNGRVNSIVYSSKLTAFATDIGPSQDKVVQTTDGGKSWSPLDKCDFVPSALCYNGDQSIAIAGLGGHVQQSDDFGQNWLESNLEACSWQAALYLDNQQILLCGAAGAIGKRK